MTSEQELLEALTTEQPDPDQVLRQLAAKRRNRAQRRRRLRALAVVIVLVALVVGGQRWWTNRQQQVPDTAAEACSDRSVSERAATARQYGATTLTGTAVLTGHSVMAYFGVRFYQVQLSNVRLLAGPRLTSTIAWIRATPEATGKTSLGYSPGYTWAPDGGFYGIVWPESETHNGLGPDLAIQPLIDGSVIFSDRDCITLDGIPTTPYTGRLQTLPGEKAYDQHTPASYQKVPLQTVLQHSK